mgnify:CR=1 FL=1
MANRYFNKQVAESRKPLAHGGPADKIKKATPMPIEVDLSNPRDKVRPNPRKKLKPFPNQAVPDRPKPKTGRPSRPMPRPRVIRDLNKRLKELQEKRKGLDPKNPKLKKSIDDLKNQIRQRPKTMIPLKSRKMSGKK